METFSYEKNRGPELMSHQASVRLVAERELWSSRELQGAYKSDPCFPSAQSPDFQPQAIHFKPLGLSHLLTLFHALLSGLSWFSPLDVSPS